MGRTDGPEPFDAGAAADNEGVQPEDAIPGIAADGSLFPIGKLDAHRQNVQHLAISVFVYDGDNQLLLQRRASGKYHSGGLWANSCCSHPAWGESPEHGAHRRLREELGFETPLSADGIIEYRAAVGGGLWENERVHLFRGTVARPRLTLVPNPDEVMETRWTTLGALSDDIARNPERYTAWLQIYVAQGVVPSR